ncbi:MAG: thiamine pyrophosphate-binding protein, partial [Burkholderiaceae bacterium]
MADNTIRGADILARTLERFGVDTIFSLSGNHIMPVYDALCD